MSKFLSISDFDNFRDSVKVGPRHYLSKDQLRFLRAVKKSASCRSEYFEAGSLVHRAQAAHVVKQVLSKDEDGSLNLVCHEIFPVPPERMIPQKGRATEGRANPQGIPVLYCASDRETAVGEVRPWIGQYVTVSAFAVKKDLRIVNCISSIQEQDVVQTLMRQIKVRHSQSEMAENVWNDIQNAFSRPVSRDVTEAEYAVTQIIAETLKSAKYDGIAYRSLVGNAAGVNIALFDLDAVTFVRSSVVLVNGMTVTIDDDGPFFE